MLLRNPVLRGFHPDPSVVCVGEDVWLATSTFEWCPGIRLHHSRDLVRWTPAGHVLTRESQLGFSGIPDSGGVWAPNLSHDGRMFHVVYPVVRSRLAFPSVAVANFLVSAPGPEGPWTDPVFLNGSGWDPSLFHAHDGRSYLLNMELDRRAGARPTTGILMQEIVLPEGRLLGSPRHVFAGTDLGCTEAPQLVEHDGWFFLITAEGGTSFGHAVTVARSRDRFGPYHADPAGPLLTSRDTPTLPLQKAGHGSLFSRQSMYERQWWMAYLCARPLPGTRDCPLGRETALARVVWTDDGWPRLAGGGRHPSAFFEIPGPAPSSEPRLRAAEDEPSSARGALPDDWMTLRELATPAWLRTSESDARMSIRGRAPLFATYEQSLVARRIDAFTGEAAASVLFEPASVHEAAGLVMYRDTTDHAFAHIAWDEHLGRCVTVSCFDRGRARPVGPKVPLDTGTRAFLRVRWDAGSYQFWFSHEGEHWQALGEPLPLAHLGDEYGGKDSFTGAMVGLAAVDAARHERWANVDWFEYRREER